jgi:hypothetical protein
MKTPVTAAPLANEAALISLEPVLLFEIYSIALLHMLDIVSLIELVNGSIKS